MLDSVRDAVEPITGTISQESFVGGGCIAHATRIDATNGRFFLKWAEGEAGLTFESEADGLRALRDAAFGLDLVVPDVFLAKNADAGAGFLLLAWIEPGVADPVGWRRFGRELARLHRAGTSTTENGPYGYAVNNWIGSKPQRNGWSESWPEFFGEKRLRAQAETVRERGAWNASWDGPLDRLIERLSEALPEAPHPSLLHGDLWAGNALATADSRFALIDPAIYVGHREADLAMTELFGGFAPSFYEGYREEWPVEPGYSERRVIYNLYHLINHLTHGPGYAAQVDLVLRRFGIR